MGWVKPDLKPILVANGARFFAAKGDDREAVVDDVVLLLKATNQELPEKVSTRIKTWYNNEIAQFCEVREKDKSSGKIKDYSEHYDEIKEEMNQAGEPWNEIHRLTIAKLWGELSEDEQEECRQKAMSINNGEISESDKCRLASASADNTAGKCHDPWESPMFKFERNEKFSPWLTHYSLAVVSLRAGSGKLEEPEAELTELTYGKNNIFSGLRSGRENQKASRLQGGSDGRMIANRKPRKADQLPTPTKEQRDLCNVWPTPWQVSVLCQSNAMNPRSWHLPAVQRHCSFRQENAGNLWGQNGLFVIMDGYQGQDTNIGQFPKWKVQKGVVNSFLEYSESFKDVGSDNSSDEEGEKKLQKVKYPWARLDFLEYAEGHGNHKDWDGYPLLPEVPKMLGTEWIGGAKIMIRTFFKEVLTFEAVPVTMHSNNQTPWKPSAMATPEGARSLIAEKYLPVGVGLKDPSRMVKAEVEAIYKLWTDRQKKTKKPLAFKVEEVRQKVAEDGRLHVAALKPKKRAYVDTGGKCRGIGFMA
ncbi:hypothetical protein B0H10DRAFT_1971813 [Mycena sp. CBHHK59/15]|nr:hypothetical protein B0H10DRAFT_1971813 [Mycena sp. CBHHK59/15]